MLIYPPGGNKVFYDKTSVKTDSGIFEEFSYLMYPLSVYTDDPKMSLNPTKKKKMDKITPDMLLVRGY